MRKRLLVGLLALCMVFSLLPFGAAAASSCSHAMTDPDTGETVSSISVISISADAETKTPGVNAQVCWQCGMVISFEGTPFKATKELCKVHQNPVTVMVQEAACEQAGLKLTYCADCGSMIRGIQPEGIPGLTHTLEFYVVQAPSCDMEGWGYAVCTDCGKPYKAESLEKALSLASDSQRAEVAKLYQALSHNYKLIKSPIDLNEDGVINHLSDIYGLCDLFPKTSAAHYETVNGQKIVSAAGTPVDRFATGADGYGAGYTGDKVCDFCGRITYGSAVESLNDAHNSSAAVIAEGYLPYIDSDGNHIDGLTDRFHCQICNKTYGGSVIPFDECPPADDTPPDTMMVNVMQPTCTEAGYTGDTWKRAKIRDTSGNESEASEAWYLFQQGEEIPPLGHDYQPIPDRDATCTMPGGHYVNGVYCTRCGEMISDRQVSYPATGHHWKDSCLAEATCRNRGISVMVCETCGMMGEMIYTRVTNHVPTVVDAVAPSCFGYGYTGDSVCKYCGEFMAKGTVLAPAGHSWSPWTLSPDAVEPEEYRECAACGATETRAVTPSPLEITLQPSLFVGNGGNVAVLRVEAVGDDITFRWQFSDNGGSTWKRSSVDRPIYNTVLTPGKDGRLVRCIVTDRYGNYVISDPAAMMISKLKVSGPSDYTGPANSTASFTVEASGEGLTYHWQYRDKNSNGFWTDSSVTSSTYKTKLTEARDGREVRCIVTDQYGWSVTSGRATMKIGVGILQQPAPYVGGLNSTATFHVEAIGDGLTYRWQFSDDGGSVWKDSSVTSDTYSTKLTAGKDHRMVRCVITDAHGNSVATMGVAMRIGVVITRQPQDYMGKENSTAKFTIAAQGDGLTYQWQTSADGSKWSNSSVKAASYSTKLTAAKDGRYVRCIVTDPDGHSTTSNAVTMRIG